MDAIVSRQIRTMTSTLQQQCGYALGILCAEDIASTGPGHSNDAGTFDYPVLHAPVGGLRTSEIPGKTPPGSDVLAAVNEEARRLEAAGVKAIIGNCTQLGFFQNQVAKAVRIPVALSCLLQLPLALFSLGAIMLDALCCTGRQKALCGYLALFRTRP